MARDLDRTDVHRITEHARRPETTVRLRGGRTEGRTAILAGKAEIGQLVQDGARRYRVTSVEPVPGRIASFLATAVLELPRRTP